jgi:hypothetical protein
MGLGTLVVKSVGDIAKNLPLSIVAETIGKDAKLLSKALDDLNPDTLLKIDFKLTPNSFEIINGLSEITLKNIDPKILDDIALESLSPTTINKLVKYGKIDIEKIAKFSDGTIQSLDIAGLKQLNPTDLIKSSNPSLVAIGNDIKRISNFALSRNIKGINESTLTSTILKQLAKDFNHTGIRGYIPGGTWTKFTKLFAENWKMLLFLGLTAGVITSAALASRGSDKTFTELIGNELGKILSGTAKGISETSSGITDTLGTSLDPLAFLKNLFENASNIVKIAVFIIIVMILYSVLK